MSSNEAVKGAAQAQTSTPPFLYIPLARLILLSVASMGWFEAYWIYKNWQYLKKRQHDLIHKGIFPFWRGVFGVFFCHGLLRRIHRDEEARSVGVPLWSPGGLATGWVTLVILAKVITIYAELSKDMAPSIFVAFVPSFLLLVPVQDYINRVTEMRCPQQRFYGWSSGHVVCIVLGVINWTYLMFFLGLPIPSLGSLLEFFAKLGCGLALILRFRGSLGAVLGGMAWGAWVAAKLVAALATSPDYIDSLTTSVVEYRWFRADTWFMVLNLSGYGCLLAGVLTGGRRSSTPEGG